MTTRDDFNTAIDDLVRGAAMKAIEEESVGLDGILDPNDSDTDNIIIDRALDGLADDDVAPLTEQEFDRKLIAMSEHNPQLAGFFSKVAKTWRKVGRKLTPKPLRKYTKRIHRRLRKIGKKLKPIVLKIAAVVVIAAALYFGYPYAKAFIGAVKAKFATGAAKAAMLKQTMIKAQQRGAPVEEQRELSQAWAEAERQRIAEEASAKRSPSMWARYASKAKNEISSFVNDYKARSAASQRQAAMPVVRQRLADEGYNFESPAAQNVMDKAIKYEQEKRGVTKGEDAGKNALMIGLPIAAMLLAKG